MSKLMDFICEHKIHKFNPIIANGVSVKQMERALEYIDYAFKLSAKSFPPPLTYAGYRKCTVQEEINFLTQKRSSKHNLELAQSDVFLVNFIFKWGDEELPPKPIMIPFLSKGGTMYARGKRFCAFPVLADETISVAKDDIFVPFLSAKVTFKRMQYWFRLDGLQRTEYLVYSKIHNHDPGKQPRRSTRANLSVKCASTIAHYLFGKFGLAATFKKFFDTDIVITEGLVDLRQYPESEYAICSSSQIKPRSVKNRNYRPNELKIIIPRNKLNNGTLGLLCGFFYVIDHYPDRFTVEALDGSIDELRLWRIIMGHVIFRNKDSEGALLLRVDEHYDSLDHYVDDMTREGLEAKGFVVSDLYDLMGLLIFEFTEILMKTNPASMYGKMLAVNRYVLADIVKAISYFKYKIISIKNKELTANDINKHLNKYLKPEVISNGMKRHNEIVNVSCAGDNIMFNYTTKTILQENATGPSKSKAPTSYRDRSKLLDISVAEAGSILVLPKSEPTGRTNINPYLQIDHTFIIKPSEALKPILSLVAKRIERR